MRNTPQRKGQFNVIHERDAYTREGSFDPDLMIAFLIAETEKAIREGYSALRVTGEMSWSLRGYQGSERVLEYEAKLNKDLFPAYPCVSICQYDRWKFDPETIKGVVLTHPLLIRGGHIYRNFYYIEPDEYLNQKKGEREVQHWLNNLERERKTLENLQESETFARAVMDHLPIGLAVNSVEPEVNFSYMNDNFPKIYRTTREALADRDAFWDVVYEDPKFRAEIKKRVLEDCASGNPEKMLWENIPLTRNGKVVAYINASNTPVPNKGLMISTVWDVTNRKKAEEDLRESEEKHRRLFETMAQGVIYQAADGAIISANPAAERILDLTFEQMQGKTSTDPRWKMIKEDGTAVPGTEHPAMIALRTGKKVGPATRGIFRPDKNDHVWLNITAIPLFQPGNTKSFQAYATFEDITERKQDEEALRRREEEFRALAENAPDIVARFDRQLRYFYINPVIEKHTGIPREKFIGHTNEKLKMPDEQVKLWNTTLLEVFREGREKEIYYDYLTPTGRKYYHSRITPEFAPDGTVETVLAISRDITRIKDMEAALYQERAKTDRMHRRSLPDDLPEMPGLTLATYYRPATALQGDYYNGVRRQNQLLLYLVDIEEGRDDGVMQSLYVRNTIEEYLRAHDDDTPVSPSILLRYLTERYQQESKEETMPLCVFIAVFEQDPATGNKSSTAADSFRPEVLRYASKGFCTPPMLIKASNEPDELTLEKLYLPLDDGADFPEQSLTITPGITFISGTDGLFNQGPGRGSYELRLQEVLRSFAHLPPELINRAVEEDFDEFCSDSTLKNDLALFVAQVSAREQRLRVKVESGFNHILGAREKVSKFLEQHLGYEPDLLHFHELLVNAIEHGNKWDGGKTVAVELVLTDRFYKVVITDQGEGFKWRNRIHRELDLDGDSERGRGIIMTRMMTDYLGYNERGNRVTMIRVLESD